MPHSIPESNFRPVIVIGGGPCALAIASRLCTQTSGAEFNDNEHDRFYWLKQRHGVSGDVGVFRPEEILVLDRLGDRFMTQWDGQFEALGIKHLRSPMFFHPDPSDVNALHAFAYAQGREDELMEIEGVVGRDPFKHQKKGRRGSTVEIDRRNWTDYYRPGTKLFEDFCHFVSKRAGLQKCVKRGKVVDIKYGALRVVNSQGDVISSDDGFEITTSDGEVYGCRIAISAIGPSGAINYPLPNGLDHQFPQGSCHSSHLFLKKVNMPPPSLELKIKQEEHTEVMIVGGGLSSAQLAERVLQMGVSKVHFVTRGEIKVQHFDFGLEWVSKNKNLTKTEFWFKTDEERFTAAMEARRGGSVNPQYLKVLHDLEARGKVVIHRHTEVSDKHWNDTTWETVTLKNNKTQRTTTLENIDYIFYCTGSTPDITLEPAFQSLLATHTIKHVHGLPCLTDDLQWSPEVPLFMLGRYAMLRTGPSSANLDGGRIGAERVGWKVQQMKRVDEMREKKSGMTELLRCTGGRCNWYGVLLDGDVSA